MSLHRVLTGAQVDLEDFIRRGTPAAGGTDHGHAVIVHMVHPGLRAGPSRTQIRGVGHGERVSVDLHGQRLLRRLILPCS